MSQLIKHYFINRETGRWATDTRFGLMMPNIKGLEIQHQLTTENEIPYCLSYVFDYFEYNVTTSAEGLQDLQNTAGITIVSSTEIPAPEATEENPNPTVSYEVVYQQDNVLETSEGLQILTQQQWDDEIVAYDARQIGKRYDVLRSLRDQMLQLTDWIVIKAKETGGTLSAGFKTWRQDLRDLPGQEIFPTSFPPLPSSLEDDNKLQELNNKFNDIRSIPMINDPLPPLPVVERPTGGN
jgi:hypothetical protein